MDLPLGQRRFYLSDNGTTMLAGRFDAKKITTRVATPDDLTVLSWFDAKVLRNEGSIDVSLSRWIVFQALKMLSEREARRAVAS